MTDPLTLLGRSDKAILGAGDGIAFAPAGEPDTPGFWSGAVVLGRHVDPLFAVTVLDADGRELVPRPAARRWTPAALVDEYRFAQGIQATEIRSVHPGGVFVSEWRLSALHPQQLHVVAWTMADSAALQETTPVYDGALTFVRETPDGEISCALAAIGGATSWGALASQGTVAAPLWRATPFLEHWRPDGLPREIRAPGPSGRWFGAVHREVRATRDGASVAFAMRAIPRERALQPPSVSSSAAPAAGTFEGASRRRWEAWFAGLPLLSTSDPYLERAYWYRWFGAWLLRIDRATGAFPNGGTSSSSGAIGVADAALVAATVRDLRWHPDPSWARSALFQFLEHQRADGSLPRHVRVDGASGANAPPTVDWGGALRALAECEPDDAHVERAWRAIERYARWLFATHDERDEGLVDLRHPEETDGASSPRFVGRRLKGADTSALAYALCRTLADLAPRAGADPASWAARAERIASAVCNKLWDEELGLFCDLDASSGRRVRVRAASGFVPLAVGLARPDAVARIAETLLDVRRFWTPFPVPSLAADEPAFDAFGEWEGVRVARPRNGRMWPGETAMVVDALVAAEPHGDGPLRRAAAQLLRRLVRWHFHDGDLHAPSAHEHANPITGHPSVYRGIDECFAAPLVDLLVRHAAGIHPTTNGIRLDPLLLGLESLSLTGLRVGRRTIDVAISDDLVCATVDGVSHETKAGEPRDAH